MPVVSVTHTTSYRYANPVGLGDHSMMLRPRPGPWTKVTAATIDVHPPATMSRKRDAFGNVVDTAAFTDQATELTIVSKFTVRHSPRTPEEIGEAVRRHRGQAVDPLEAADLAEASRRHRTDPGDRVGAWAREVRDDSCGGNAFDLMVAINGRIYDDFGYARREAEGTQDPLITLDRGTGSCRDFALFMMEAARSLGYPARFVSGYVYDAEGRYGAVPVGGGSTHAWAEINLPGAGWVEFDPTNNNVGGSSLVAVASVLEPSQALPVSGYFDGYASDFLGMDVSVATDAMPDRPAFLHREIAEPVEGPAYARA